MAKVEAAAGARSANRSGPSTLFVIHGMGTGRLKEAIWEALRRKSYVMKARCCALQAPAQRGIATCPPAGPCDVASHDKIACLCAQIEQADQKQGGAGCSVLYLK